MLMTPTNLSDVAVRRQLDRILAGPGFSNNQRLSAFLRFVVEHELSGRGDELKEIVIGIEVLGRPADYNPKKDSIVRAEAGRLRARLSEYYLGEGRTDPVMIELPKGGYVPVIRTSIVPGAEPLPTPPRRRVWPFAVPVGIAAILLIVVTWRWSAQRREPVRIAVVPFDNLNHDPSEDYLADGLTDELIRTLSGFDGLAPRSRMSSFALKGRPWSIHDAARELQADYVVAGSILRSGDRLRVDAQLVRARDDISVWAGKFDRDVSNVIGVQDEISLAIANSLRLKLGRGRRRYEGNPEAYDLYLHARASDFRNSVGPFQQAIVKDPSFALAYAGLAATYAYRTSTVYFDRQEEIIKMRAAADKAVELDPLSAEAQDALAMSYARDGLWGQAEKSFRRAIELEPNRSETYADFAMYLLLPLGRFPEALHWMRVAQRSDPLSEDARLHLTWVLFSSHRYEEAAPECGKLAEPYRSECVGRVSLGRGRMADAAKVMEAEVGRGVEPGAPIRGYLAYAYAKVGRRAEAERIAAMDQANPYHQVLAYIGLGETDRAFDALGRMVKQGPMRLGVALSAPELEDLRGDRTAALRKAAGLP